MLAGHQFLTGGSALLAGLRFFPPPWRGRAGWGVSFHATGASFTTSQSTVKVGRKSSGASDDARSKVPMLDSSITYNAGPTCFR